MLRHKIVMQEGIPHPLHAPQLSTSTHRLFVMFGIESGRRDVKGGGCGGVDTAVLETCGGGHGKRKRNKNKKSSGLCSLFTPSPRSSILLFFD